MLVGSRAVIPVRSGFPGLFCKMKMKINFTNKVLVFNYSLLLMLLSVDFLQIHEIYLLFHANLISGLDVIVPAFV